MMIPKRNLDEQKDIVNKLNKVVEIKRKRQIELDELELAFLKRYNIEKIRDFNHMFYQNHKKIIYYIKLVIVYLGSLWLF